QLRPAATGPLGRDVPAPHHTVDPQGEAGRPLRSLALPALRLLATEELLDIAEGVLDRPSPGVGLGDPGGGGRRAVGKKKSSGSTPAGSRAMTSSTWDLGHTRYHSTGRLQTSRVVFFP